MTPHIDSHSPASSPAQQNVPRTAGRRVINFQSTLERFGYDGELFREMAQLFQMDAPYQLERLELAAESRDAEQAVLAAHSLRGLAATFDARRVVDDAAEVELAARRQEWPALLPALRELRQAVEEVHATLQAYASEA